ncbi:MAG TPA: ABC transporter permease [Syntrophomonadaceae bacterium]|nr:ABC transporter permease [Syntrophomonadaceae bacterium]
MDLYSILTAILSATIIAGTPILFASLGELLTEKAGVLNLGVEGMMMIGAVAGFLVSFKTMNPWLGIIAAMLAGGCLSLVHALMSVSLRVNQVVSGLALTILGTGLSAFLGKSMIGIQAPVTFNKMSIPVLSKIPFIGPILFQNDILVYLSIILVLAFWFLIYKTKHGLRLRAVGENPAAADAMGVNVFAFRYLYVVIGGMLAGLGGAYLSLVYTSTWLENMTAGRGWIAVALVIFATWNPLRALLGAYIFGGVEASVFRLQALNILRISSFFLKMLPYILTVIVLYWATRETVRKRIGAPSALGLPYEREER